MKRKKVKWTPEYKKQYMSRYNAINREKNREWSNARYQALKEEGGKEYEEFKASQNERTKIYNKEHRKEKTEYFNTYYHTEEGKARVKAAKARYYAKLKAKREAERNECIQESF